MKNQYIKHVNLGIQLHDVVGGTNATCVIHICASFKSYFRISCWDAATASKAAHNLGFYLLLIVLTLLVILLLKIQICVSVEVELMPCQE